VRPTPAGATDTSLAFQCPGAVATSGMVSGVPTARVASRPDHPPLKWRATVKRPSGTPIEAQAGHAIKGYGRRPTTNDQRLSFFPSRVRDGYLDLIGMVAFLAVLVQGRSDVEVSLSALN
jgi:hypothetical protein